MTLLGKEQKDLKRCPKCDQYKGAIAFYRSKATADGLAGWCKTCMDQRRRENFAKKRPPRSYNRITEEGVQRVLDAYRQTKGNQSAIARITGYSRDTIRKVITENTERIRKEVPPDPIPHDDLTEEAKRGLEDFLFFSSRYMGLEFDPWAKELADELLRAYHSDDDEWLLVNVAFGAGKSTVATYLFVCWVICRERAYGREPTIFLGHRAEDRAKWYLRRINQAFTLNRDLISAYGRFKPENKGATPWSTWELTVEPLDWSILREKEPTIAIGSYEGATMGGHFKIVLWDDIVDKKNSSSRDQREKLDEFGEQTAESRPKPGGLFAYIGARFGPEDLFANRKAQKYEDEEEKRVWRHIIYKAHYPELCTGEHPRNMPAYPESCLLSPKLVPWARIRKAMLRERTFLLSYQQEDVDPEGSLADPAWFEGGTDKAGMMVPGCFDRGRMFGDPGRKDAPVLSAITVDPAAQKGFWAIIHLVLFQDGDQVVIRGLRKPMQAPDLLYREASGRFTGVCEDWWQASKNTAIQPRYLIVETKSQQTYLRQYEFVQTWCQNRGVVLLPHDTSRVNKADPSRGVENNKYLFREGKVRFPYGGTEERYFADAFKREAASWPEGTTDDLVMAHWFWTFNMPTLIAAGQVDDLYDDDRPEWSKIQTPEWAQEMVRSG